MVTLATGSSIHCTLQPQGDTNEPSSGPSKNKLLPVPVLTHWLQKLKLMNRSLMMIWSKQPHFPVQMMDIYHFIALIHPIQWTIALPVGATGPAKRQKKTSCIYYRQDRSGECIRQVAHRTSSSCLDIVTS